MARDTIKDAYQRWLMKFPWMFMICLTFRKSTSAAVAKLRVDRWLKMVQQKLNVHIKWALVVEQGKASRHIHVHVLLAGISPTDAVASQLQQLWPYGVADVRKFDSAKREQGVAYFLKTVTADNSDQLDVSFSKETSNDASSRRRKHTCDSQPRKVGSLPRTPAASKAQISGETLSVSHEKVRRGGGLYVRREQDSLVIVLPLKKPRPSSTGKTAIVGSTGGLRPTLAEFEGRPILVNVVATINPKGPAWKQRIAPLLANWEEKFR
jgi:hypothetical protein